jgi:four helix bundle protein
MGFKFRNWQIYKDLRKFRSEVIKEIVLKIPKEERFEIVSQLKRALNSSILNVAEGAYRKSNKDLAHFLNQADSSLNEVVACFDICLDDGFIDKKIHSDFVKKVEKLTAQLAGFRKYLKNNEK